MLSLLLLSFAFACHAGMQLEMTGTVLDFDASEVALEIPGGQLKVPRSQFGSRPLRPGESVKVMFASTEEIRRAVVRRSAPNR